MPSIVRRRAITPETIVDLACVRLRYVCLTNPIPAERYTTKYAVGVTVRIAIARRVTVVSRTVTVRVTTGMMTATTTVSTATAARIAGVHVAYN